jgi:hypothetical protein
VNILVVAWYGVVLFGYIGVLDGLGRNSNSFGRLSPKKNI